MHPFYLVFVICCMILCNESMNALCRQTQVAFVTFDASEYLGWLCQWVSYLFLGPRLVATGEHLDLLVSWVIWKGHSLHDSFKEISNIFL